MGNDAPIKEGTFSSRQVEETIGVFGASPGKEFFIELVSGDLAIQRQIEWVMIAEGAAGLVQITRALANSKTLMRGISRLFKGNGKSAFSKFTKQKAKVIEEAKSILDSEDFQSLAEAVKNNKPAQVKINGKNIQFEPDIPESSGISAMTLDDGFVLSKRAFSSAEELTKTVLQVLHRLKFSSVVKTGSADAASAAETIRNAFQFAEDVYNALSN